MYIMYGISIFVFFVHLKMVYKNEYKNKIFNNVARGVWMECEGK